MRISIAYRARASTGLDHCVIAASPSVLRPLPLEVRPRSAGSKLAKKKNDEALWGDSAPVFGMRPKIETGLQALGAAADVCPGGVEEDEAESIQKILEIEDAEQLEQADDSLSDDDVEGLALDQVIEHAIAIGQPIADW